MPDFVCPIPPRTLTISSPVPCVGVAAWEGDEQLDDHSIQVTIGAAVPWSFEVVLHADDTVTMPAEAAGITVTVTRP
jgi:hypothetical protein